MRKSILYLFLVAFWSTILVLSCKPKEIDTDPVDRSSLPDWTTETHGKTNPNYEAVFNQQTVNRLDIVLTKTQWDSIKTDANKKLGMGFGEGFSSTNQGNGNINFFGQQDPDYFAVAVKANGRQWYKVGFRLKGNSTLGSVWQAGSYKLPFRLNFDKFENQYTAIANQRFYGFKELSMSPAAIDASLIRQKLTSDIFREAGVPAPETAFYRVYIDFGEGARYCGVYTMTELPEDQMIKQQFGEDKGNIYKPESAFIEFKQNEFEKKNNKTAADYSDVKAAITALNDTLLKKQNPAQWRTNLEKSLDVNHFLKWLAINTIIVNWDAYGSMTHNYYLYNHSTRKLVWIPWDFDLALAGSNINLAPGNGMEPGVIAPGDGAIIIGDSTLIPITDNLSIGKSVELSLETVSKKWPLIRYIADDPVYYATYKKHIRTFIDNTFTESRINSKIDAYYDLISPYVNGILKEERPYSNLSNLSSFTEQRSVLKEHIKNRVQTARDFLK